MNKTLIQWTQDENGEAGARWNPTRGCSRISLGCVNCYAEAIAARFSGPKQPFEGYAERTPEGDSRWTGRVELLPNTLDAPLRLRKAKRIFVNSMSDLFHRQLMDREIDRVFAVMAMAAAQRGHTFLVLTKRGGRMREYMNAPQRRLNVSREIALRVTGQLLEDVPAHLQVSWPPSGVQLGVSVEDKARFRERLPQLLDTQAAVRFISFEPLLEEIDVRDAVRCPGDTDGDGNCPRYGHQPRCPTADWAIVGGESGDGARPMEEDWARRIVRTFQAAKVPVFMKQMGRVWAESHERGPGPGRPNLHGDNTILWPEDLRVREYPKRAEGRR